MALEVLQNSPTVIEDGTTQSPLAELQYPLDVDTEIVGVQRMNTKTMGNPF